MKMRGLKPERLSRLKYIFSVHFARRREEKSLYFMSLRRSSGA
jgi:hypothetical protein